MNYNTEAQNSYLTCLKASKSGAGNSIPGLSDREALVLISLFPDPCFGLCVSLACPLI